jgi:NTE family protein
MARRLLYSFTFLFVFTLTIFSQTKTVLRPEGFHNNNFSGNIYRPDTPKRPKVALVLSGGGARGFSQIGVLKVLEKYNIPVNLIVGNSIGSIIGGLYASGYSAAELESIATSTNWDEVLSLTEETKRSELFLDQKQVREKSFLVIRFNGLEPIIPSSISGGQRITNYLSSLTLQALYHPNPSFDGLKIPFRATASDLVSGKRYIFDTGSLAEAMRASVAVPFLFTALDKDSLSLVDGGLVSNIPVDVAKSLGSDIVIVVNSTSEILKLPEHSAPWETADQIMTIMMQVPNQTQISMADILLKPLIGNRLASDFSNISSLIKAGEDIAESNINNIISAIHQKRIQKSFTPDTTISHFNISFSGDDISSDIKDSILTLNKNKQINYSEIVSCLNQLYSLDIFQDIHAEVSTGNNITQINFYAKKNPDVKDVVFSGNKYLTNEEINRIFSEEKGNPFNPDKLSALFESLLLRYRQKGYCLAKIDSTSFDKETGKLSFTIKEGMIKKIYFLGNDHIAGYVLRREFPLQPADVFQINAAQKGVTNISSLGLFEYVLLEIQEDELGDPIVIVRVKEKITDLVRFGISVNNERGFVSQFDIRSTNFRGHGEELGLILNAGLRDRLAQLDYQIFRLFNTYLTSNLKLYFRFHDINTYANTVDNSQNHWERNKLGEYRLIRYGGTLGFGTQLERLGNILFEFRREQQEIKEKSPGGYNPEKYQIAIFKIGTTIDTKNQTTFSTEGMMLAISYESSFKTFANSYPFTKLTLQYESYFTIFGNHTLRPKILFGIADATLPLAEQYTLGGLNSFLGLRDYDSRGRQILLINTEYRLRFPFKIIYDTYFSLRYDLGMISSVPQELKLSGMQHGIGALLGLDTPIGPIIAAVGQSFFLPTKVNAPIFRGPVLFYFSVGCEF